MSMNMSRNSLHPGPFFPVLFILKTTMAFCLSAYEPVMEDPVLEPMFWQSYPELSNLGIRCMVEDNRGQMWFGTGRQGVISFDGIQIRKTGLAGSTIHVLHTDQNGSVYAGNDQNVFRYDGGEWVPLLPCAKGFYWFVSHIAPGNIGDIWISTAWGAVHYSDNHIWLYAPEEVARSIGKIYPSIHINYIPENISMKQYYISGLDFDVATSAQADSVMLVKSVAPGGIADKAGLRVGDRIFRVDGRADSLRRLFENVTEPHVVLSVLRFVEDSVVDIRIPRRQMERMYHHFWVTDIMEDRDGILWLGLYNHLSRGAVVRFDTGAKNSPERAWRIHSIKDCSGIGGGLLGGRILNDREGHIWLVSLNGICRSDGSRWVQEQKNRIRWCHSVVKTRDGHIWVGQTDQVSRWDGDKWTMYTSRKTQIPRGQLKLYSAADGALWILSIGNSVYRLGYETPRWKIYRDLYFQCESAEGSWFLDNNHHIIQSVDNRWYLYGNGDDIMDMPQAMSVDSSGVVWMVGNDRNQATVARFIRGRWEKRSDSQFICHATQSGVLIDRNGGLWFGGSRKETDPESDWGVLSFSLPPGSGKTEIWKLHAPPEAPIRPWDITQTSDGKIWVGGEQLYWYDGRAWNMVPEPDYMNFETEAIAALPGGGLWVGSRSSGALFFDGRSWTQYSLLEGLADNMVTCILPHPGGIVWAGTERGISAFDGTLWTPLALPRVLTTLSRKYDPHSDMRLSRDGAIWINGQSRCIRYYPFNTPPQTELTVFSDRVPHPGNTIISWRGTDPWHQTPNEDLVYSYRIDGCEWSPFHKVTSHAFLKLGDGQHVFEVRARDGDYNVQTTPTGFYFEVVPLVWKQTWFRVLMIFLILIILVLLIRLVQWNRRLQDSNIALTQKTRELERSNDELKNFAYVASHELQEPLRSVASYVQLLAQRYRDRLGREADEFIQFAVTGVNRMHHVINDFLVYTQLGKYREEMNSVECEEVLALVLENLAEIIADTDANITYDPLPKVEGQIQELIQLFHHLIDNALKFRNENAPAIHVAAEDKDEVWQFAFRDNGIGIAPKYHERIFRLFQRLFTREEYAGTGIGLAICKKIVEENNGKIWVDSQEGQGATFYFTWPKSKRYWVSRDAV